LSCLLKDLSGSPVRLRKSRAGTVSTLFTLTHSLFRTAHDIW
jgi:hypothetical protein